MMGGLEWARMVLEEAELSWVNMVVVVGVERKPR